MNWSRLCAVIAYFNKQDIDYRGSISGKTAKEIRNKFINSTEILFELYAFLPHNICFFILQ